MKHVSLFFLGIVWLSQIVYSQSNTAQLPDTLLQKTLVKIDTLTVSVQDFLWYNTKYNTASIDGKTLSLDEYIELFIQYKRKVLESLSQQIDTSSAFLREFNSYMRQISSSYLLQEEDIDSLVALQYNRLQYDYKVQHIFIRSDRFANPKDTLEAYQKATRIISELRRGRDFGELAREHSDDTFSKDEGGNIGYVTSLVMPLEYENILYAGRVGQVLGPISTRYGYFIIKILDIRKSLGQRRASLIVLYPSGENEQEWEEVEQFAHQVYNSLRAGASFDSLAMKYNQSKDLLKNRGDIGWFDNSVLYPIPLKEALFACDSVGQYTQPIQQKYGFIIAKLTGIDSLQDFETYAAHAKSTIQQDESRKSFQETMAVSRFLKKTDVSIQYQNLENFISLVDNAILMGRWQIPAFTDNKVLFSVGETQYRYSHFASYLFQNQRERRISEKDILVRYRFNQYLQRILLFEAFQNLMKEDYELSMLSQEYYHGMLMIELMQKEVYKKAFLDTLGLYKYYNLRKQEFLYPESVTFAYFSCDSERTARNVQKNLHQRPGRFQTDSLVLQQANRKNPKAVKLSYKTYYRGESKEIDALPWNVGAISKKSPLEIRVVNEVTEPYPKEFELVRSLLIADYQNYLLENFEFLLTKKYPAQIFEEYVELIKQYLELDE